jgi:hypothetical protein
MHSFWFGILGGIVAWVATMLIGRPFYEAVNLRREAARTLRLYEPEGNDSRRTIQAWLEERATVYQACAANLFAFESSESITAEIVKNPPFRWQLTKAAEYFWQLAPLGPGAPERNQLLSDIAKALHLKRI